LLTAEEVALAYQLFLGRVPENQNVVTNLCHTLNNTQELRDAFLKSSEFRSLMEDELHLQSESRQRHPFTAPLIPVEVEVSDDILDVMFSRVQREWVGLGEKEPYWSVLTQPEYTLQEFEQHRDQFFKTGNGLAYIFLSALRRNGVNPNLIETCLEVGCGVGRVTAHLAKNFNRVIACDVSKPHLDLAQDYLSKADINNVTLSQWKDLRSLHHLPKVDAIFSVITLQHNPPPVSAWILKILLNALRSGGVAYFQIATYRSGYLFEVERYLNLPPQDNFEMHFLPQKDIFKLISQANCSVLEVREDPLVGSEEVMLSNTFLVQKNA
jgi:SAM-dependent methyltransferase